jgi:hypothetical protein
MILRETKIDDLAELCQTLLAYVSTTEDGPQSARSATSIVSSIDALEAQRRADDAAAAVQFLVRKTLEDSQNRLVFRAQQYVRSEIQNFNPKIEDIELLARGRGCIVFLWLR